MKFILIVYLTYHFASGPAWTQTEEALKKGLEVLSPKPSSSLAKSGKEKQKDYRK